MKRRHLVLASVGMAGAAAGGLSRAAKPCPPPSVTVGAKSASTVCPVPATGTYSTRFGGTENPIAESGRWVNGKAAGQKWNDVQTSSGKAFGAQFVSLGGSRYDDCIAHLNGSFGPNQYAQGVVSRIAGYRNPSDKHEIELLLRFEITPNNARGYEVLWGQDGEISVVRWNGPLGSYTSFGGIGSSASNMAVEGDVLRAEIVGNVINVYRNGVLMVSKTDSTYNTGHPGIGFWPLPGATLSAYAWKAFEAGNL
ncbi:MAG: hypothetical protein U1E89_03675 [Burkholderiaceae bacterium]